MQERMRLNPVRNRLLLSLAAVRKTGQCTEAKTSANGVEPPSPSHYYDA